MIDEFLESAETRAQVGEAVRKAAAEEVMPRFRQLGADEITRKSGPDDLVTVADRRAEEHLGRSLTALLPGSVLVGEEGVYADPGLLDAVRGDDPVWIVDPVDGTRRFVNGSTGFCMMASLAHRGRVLASWTYLPPSDLMAVAVRGGGARLNGEPLRSGSPAPGAVLDVALSHHDFTSAAEKRTLARLDVPAVRLQPSGSAGLDYLRVARGEIDAVAFSWQRPWDHAAGLLLVAEAGGAEATVAGEPFRVGGGNALPFTAARDAETVRHILALLNAD